jgi:glycosyltransferase A (GT-A) superfamily protein (DUF2064 family)
MNIGAAIFVKTPGLSGIKTRLAKEIGKNKAALFYQLALSASKSLVKNIYVAGARVNFNWAIAEREGMDDPLWSGENQVFQKEGGLGDRLNHIYGELLLKNDLVIFMGSDSPHINSSYLSSKLSDFIKSSHDFLIGPAEDGGFYFLAGRKPIAKELWCGVEYSSTKTLTQLVDALNTIGNIEYIRTDFDVDDLSSLKKLEDVPRDNLTKTQLNLLENLGKVL